MLDKIIKILGICFFVLAIYLLNHEINQIGLKKIDHLFEGFPKKILIIVGFLVILDFIFLALYDKIGLLYLRKKLAFQKIFKVASLGYAVSNTTGHAYLSGGSIRYIFYSQYGLSKVEILKIVVLDSLTYLLGISGAFIFAFILYPFENISLPLLYKHITEALSFILIIFLLFYVFFVIKKVQFIIKGYFFKLPNLKMTLTQMIIGLADTFTVAFILYLILSQYLSISFIHVAIIFMIAQMLGLATQIPGGIGVFESIFLYLASQISPQKGEILTALIIFRVVYFFIPFILAGSYFLFRFMKSRIYPKKNLFL